MEEKLDDDDNEAEDSDAVEEGTPATKNS